MLQIAHISDLHLSRLSLDPRQLFSKQIFGNLNWLFSRRKTLPKEPIFTLVDFLEKKQISHLIVTGDLTATATIEEFAIAKHFFTDLEKKKITPLFVPGNHDVYTNKAYKENLFRKLFSNPSHPLSSDLLSVVPLKENWWFLGLFAAKPTPVFSSRGYFTIDLEKALLAVLKKLPKESKIILCCHFPFSKISFRKSLQRREALEKIIRDHPQIHIYLHGHTHIPYIKKEHNLPLVIDGGCASNTLHILEIDKSNCKIDKYHFANSWQLLQTDIYSL